MPGRLLPRTWTFDPSLQAPPKYRRACSYSSFVPDLLQDLSVTLDARTAGIVSDAEAAIRSLNAIGGHALAPLATLLLRTESIASSKVEGMQLGPRELARAEARAESGQKASDLALEVLANIDAMVIAVDEASTGERFAVTEITAIHRRLLERSAHASIAGVIREQQNWIGGNDYNPCGAEFVPPPPEDLALLLADLCEAINDESVPPLVQAALVHAQFETIHPFADGNGRTGRALIHVVLRRRGLAPRYLPPISVILAGAKERYVAGLTAFRGDAIQEWIAHFATAASRAARLAATYLEEVGRLAERWRAQLASSASPPRRGAAAWALIDVLPAHPMITAPVAVAATGRAKAAVYQALQQLTGAGVLQPLSASRRNQTWEAQGLLALIEGLEAGRFLPASA